MHLSCAADQTSDRTWLRRLHDETVICHPIFVVIRQLYAGAGHGRAPCAYSCGDDAGHSNGRAIPHHYHERHPCTPAYYHANLGRYTHTHRLFYPPSLTIAHAHSQCGLPAAGGLAARCVLV